MKTNMSKERQRRALNHVTESYLVHQACKGAKQGIYGIKSQSRRKQLFYSTVYFIFSSNQARGKTFQKLNIESIRSAVYPSQFKRLLRNT